MKKISLILTAAFLSVSTMGAMANMADNFVIESNYDGNKTKVEKDELPQEVIKSLEESDYKNWEIQEAYKVEDELTNVIHYELHLASDLSTQMVRNVTFTEDGEIISEKESDLGRTEDLQFEQLETEPGFEGTDPGMDTEPGLEETEPDTEAPGQQY
jgi:hypothetical protein